MATFPIESTAAEQDIPNLIEPETVLLFKRIQLGEATLEELQHRLDKDPKLEGFINGAAFERRLENLLNRRVTGVLVAVDLDLFKQFNDSEGHPAGNEMISIAARLLHGQTRTTPPTAKQQEQRQNPNQDLDLLGHVGGDEMSVFFVGASLPDAIAAAKRVRHAIVIEAKKTFPNYGSEQTMSLGLSEVRTGDTSQALQQRADEALYEAKKGKGSKEIIDSIAIN